MHPAAAYAAECLVAIRLTYVLATAARLVTL